MGRRPSVLPLLLATIAAAAHSTMLAHAARCGAQQPSPAAADSIQADLQAAMVRRVGTSNLTLAAQRLAAPSANGRAAAPAAGVRVNVRFHVIRSGGATYQGNIPDSVVQAQIKVLNDKFAQTGVTFVLKSLDRTTSARWFNNKYLGTSGMPSAAQTQARQVWREMTHALYKGGIRDLNMYSWNVTFPILGFSSFPWQYKAAAFDDGVHVSYDSLPGRARYKDAGYNLGLTGAHESGHWLGLFHPFQGGCAAPGDAVSDTNPEAQPVEVCLTAPAYSCGTSKADPFQNIMDYPPDRCMNVLTPGQAARIATVWDHYRPPGPDLKRPTPKPTHKPTKTPTRRPTKPPPCGVTGQCYNHYCYRKIKGKTTRTSRRC